MDGNLKPLVQTKELKTNLLKQYQGRGLYLRYDHEFDALLLQIVPPETETVVHYLSDPNVALVYEKTTKEIVGIQIENFEYSFLPKHHEIMRVWKLSDSAPKQANNLGDMMVTVERIQPVVAEKVACVSAPLLREEEPELEALICETFSQNRFAADAY